METKLWNQLNVIEQSQAKFLIRIMNPALAYNFDEKISKGFNPDERFTFEFLDGNIYVGEKKVNHEH